MESIDFDDSGQYNGSGDSGATGDSCDIADSIESGESGSSGESGGKYMQSSTSLFGQEICIISKKRRRRWWGGGVNLRRACVINFLFSDKIHFLFFR